MPCFYQIPLAVERVLNPELSNTVIYKAKTMLKIKMRDAGGMPRDSRALRRDAEMNLKQKLYSI